MLIQRIDIGSASVPHKTLESWGVRVAAIRPEYFENRKSLSGKQLEKQVALELFWALRTDRLRSGRVKHLAPRARAFESKVHRPCANRPCAMTDPSVNGDHLPREEFDGPIVEIDVEAAFQRQKAFVGVGVTVPVIRFGHRADPNLVIVDLSNRMIVVPFNRC